MLKNIYFGSLTVTAKNTDLVCLSEKPFFFAARTKMILFRLGLSIQEWEPILRQRLGLQVLEGTLLCF